MDKQKNWFFGSKLNTALLLILIMLMVIALQWMSEEPGKYFPMIEDRIKAEEKIEGNIENLITFSIKPGQEVSGVMKATGVLSGGYFFEGNLPVAILDGDKNLTTYGPGHGQATTDSWTAGPVSFEIDFDFSKMPKGKAYIKLTQDDPSGGESGRPIQSILIPIVIK